MITESGGVAAQRVPSIHTGALISECGLYRYSLTRRWGSPHADRVLFVMLNPSTADATQDDPTIRRCIAFAQAWGFASLEVVNLFAWRSTSPLALLTASDAVGPDNDTSISAAAKHARRAVLAHGSHRDERLRQRVCARSWTVRAILTECGHDLLCLARTKDRMPRHPLYLKGDLRPIPLGVA